MFGHISSIPSISTFISLLLVFIITLRNYGDLESIIIFLSSPKNFKNISAFLNVRLEIVPIFTTSILFLCYGNSYSYTVKARYHWSSVPIKSQLSISHYFIL